MAINIRSLCNKWDLFCHDLLDNIIDVICCSETWLNEFFPNSLVTCDTYQLFQQDRTFKNVNGTTKHGDGLCCYVKTVHAVDTQKYAHFNQSTPDLELQCLQIRVGANKPLVIINTYRPPAGNLKSAIDYLDNIFEVLSQVRRIDIVCLGDFNVNWLKPRDSNAVQLSQFAKSWNLTQSITNASRVTNRARTLIVLLFHKINDYTFADSLLLSLSDHFPVAICKKVSKQPSLYIKFTGRSYRHFDEEQFCTDIIDADWSLFDELRNPDAAWDVMYSFPISCRCTLSL